MPSRRTLLYVAFGCSIILSQQKSNLHRCQLLSRLPAFLLKAPVPSLFSLIPLMGEAWPLTLALDSQGVSRESGNQVKSHQRLFVLPLLLLEAAQYEHLWLPF